MHYDRDIEAGRFSLCVIGYGSQGRAQALNLRDSGLDVKVALREGPSAKQAREEGLAVVSLDRATEADVVQFLVPDLAQPALFEEWVRPRLGSQTLLFSHGFCVHHGLIRVPAGCDVVMVAPKGPGKLVRDTYVKGSGVPCLVAVHQDASGRAMKTALAHAKAIGGARAGVIETTFREETETDLFGEQAVLCGGVTELVTAGFDTLTSAGYQPEVAYFEVMHELKLIVDLLHEGGLARMHEFVSDTAKYGDLTRGGRIVDGRVRESMKQVLREVQDGTFGREWTAEVRSGMARYRELMKKDMDHPIEAVGRRLRGLMAGGGR
jgi:ketol-acid reductoisomerase